MPKSTSSSHINLFHHSPSEFGVSLSILILLTCFSTTVLGQVAIPITQLNPQLPKSLELDLQGIGVFDNHLFVNTKYSGLWILSEDGTEVKKVGGAKGVVDGAVAVHDKLFISSNGEVWLIDGEDAIQIKNASGAVTCVEIAGNQFFVGTERGLWAVSRNGEQAKQLHNIEGAVAAIESFHDRLFVITEDGLWAVDKDGNQTTRIKDIEGNIYRIKKIDDELFVSTFTGLWIVSNGGEQVRWVEAIESSVHGINYVDNRVFVGTDDGLWILNKDGEQAEKVDGIERIVSDIYQVGDKLVVTGSDGLWFVNKDGTQVKKIESIKGRAIDLVVQGKYVYVYVNGRELNGKAVLHYVYRIDPNVKIGTKLSQSSWWANFTGYFFPSNWLPAENTQVEASYSDENGTDPYPSLPNEFRFAKAENDDVLPPDDRFSPQEQFRYDIGWGNNNVHYWLKDKWGNAFEQQAVYRGIPSQYFFSIVVFILPAVLILGCLALSPKIDFCHSAIMNPWLRRYFSLGSVPLLLSVSPSLRRHVLWRYSNSINKDKEFTEWKSRFVCPDDEFLPENFGKKLNDENRLLLTGDSGIGKTSYFKYLVASYVSENTPPLPGEVLPVYIPLTNYGPTSLEELVYNQLFSYGAITDRELAPIFLERGGLLIFLDGVNEVQDVAARQTLGEFVNKFGASNYICVSSQQIYPEIENIPKVALKSFDSEKIAQFIRQRVDNKEVAEGVITKLTDEEYHLYGVPRDLEFGVEILNGGGRSLPKTRTELYRAVFASIFANWKESGNLHAESDLCKRAYTMITERDLAFDSVENPKFETITADLFKQKFLVRREKSYNFRHDLILSYLATQYFYPRWQYLLNGTDGRYIDSNWLEMLKFASECIHDADEVKTLVYVVLDKTVLKELVKSLFEWLRINQPSKCKPWETDFYTKYGAIDFR